MRRFGLFTVVAIALAACSETPSAPTPVRLIQSTAASKIAGSYIVVFRNDVQNVDDEAQRLAVKHAGKVQHKYKAALKGMSIELSDAQVAALRADASVAFVEQDQPVSALGCIIDATCQSGATWGLDRVDQRALPLDASYSYFVNGSGVTVYIIDTGINFGHTEFGGRASKGFDAVTSGGTAADCNGHGTHVAGTVGGSTYGIAKAVTLKAVRVLNCAGSGTTSGVIAGIDWVTANRVLPAAANMSLGGGFSSALNQAVENSIAAGVTYAIAAGNSSANACNASPASAPNAITVGATQSNDGFASFSNFGTCVDINAPGVGITSAWYTSNTATNTISGTSMAAPHVAGAAALFLSANPSATPAQVTAALNGDATAGAIISLPSGTPNRLLYTANIGSGSQPPPPPPPTLTASYTYSCSRLTCSFNGSSSVGAATYSWTFGDGGTATGVTTSHTFAGRASYTVTLTVENTGPTASNSTSKTITCNPQRCS
jgi:subtilisin family serine protease